jgi:demethylmenaquinone methyltransferase/2-methoxy-6-polyprenyl-1,4-benzoquinol methylase
MTIHKGKPTEIRRIHGRNDFLNCLISLGRDQRWRRRAVAHLEPPTQSRMLDIVAGTGDLSAEVLRREPWAQTYGSHC